MKKAFDSAHLDIPAFAQAGAELEDEARLQDFPRLMEEAAGQGGDRAVSWFARGEWRSVAGGAAQAWLHLSGDTVLPLVCQRCLEIADIAVGFEQTFRFVADEATAEAEDDASEEDLLVTSRDFSLHDLVEDELIMALPAVPTHDVCPTPVKLAVQDAAFDAAMDEKPHPFAALANLQKPESDR